MSPFTALPSVQLGHGCMEGAAWVLQLRSGWVEVYAGDAGTFCGACSVSTEQNSASKAG